MLLAEPPTQPCRCVPVDEPVGWGNGAETTVIGPTRQLSIQTGHHLLGLEPFHVSGRLLMNHLGDALDTLLRGRTSSRVTSRHLATGKPIPT